MSRLGEAAGARAAAPADAAGKVLGVQPRDPDGGARFSNVVHVAATSAAFAALN